MDEEGFWAVMVPRLNVGGQPGRRATLQKRLRGLVPAEVAAFPAISVL
jgi:hypothetical protein